MSDWFGTYSVDPAINGGLDLEMPGLNKWRALDFTKRCIDARKVTVRTIKERALQVLKLVQKCSQGAPEVSPRNPRVLYMCVEYERKVLEGDRVERTKDSNEEIAFLQKVATESIVLLKNDNGLLPIDKTKVNKVAIVGGNAKAVILSGGGSAALKPSFFVSPYDGIAKALGDDVKVTYGEGARGMTNPFNIQRDPAHRMYVTLAYLTLPTIERELTTEDGGGTMGWTAKWYSHESDESMIRLDTPMATQFLDETRVFIATNHPEGITRRWTVTLRGFMKPRDYDIDFEFGLIAFGRAKVR